MQPWLRYSLQSVNTRKKWRYIPIIKVTNVWMVWVFVRPVENSSVSARSLANVVVKHIRIEQSILVTQVPLWAWHSLALFSQVFFLPVHQPQRPCLRHSQPRVYKEQLAETDKWSPISIHTCRRGRWLNLRLWCRFRFWKRCGCRLWLWLRSRRTVSRESSYRIGTSIFCIFTESNTLKM